MTGQVELNPARFRAMDSFSPQTVAAILIGGAVLGWYVATRVATAVMISHNAVAPGRRAAIYMLPVLALTAGAAWTGALPAVAIPLAASVAAATLVLCIVLAVRVLHAPAPAPQVDRRRWAFLVPVALLVLLAGFSGRLRPTHALALAVEGIAICAAWRWTAPGERAESDRAAGRGPRWARFPAMLLAAAVIVIASACAVSGAGVLAQHSDIFRNELTVAIVLGPALALQMIPPLATLAELGRSDEAVSCIVAFVILNLCAALPIAAASHAAALGWRAMALDPPPATAPSTRSATAPADLPDTAAEPTDFSLAFPLASWRVDTVLLLAVGVLLLPASQNKWRLVRLEGAGLGIAYAGYIFVHMLLSRG